MDSIAKNLTATALCVARFDVDGGASGRLPLTGALHSPQALRLRSYWREQKGSAC